MIILGIESSCDETACGIVRDGNELLANAVLSSMDLHKAYGGVVPEIAARSHIESIIPVIDQALSEAFDSKKSKVESRKYSALPSDLATLPYTDPWDQIDGIAVTYGAGLGGSLLVGVMTARTLAITKNKPLYAINHVEAHVYANFLTELGPGAQGSGLSSYVLPTTPPQFPCLALIVSGGHSQLVLFRDHFDYTLLGQTQDDAIGEAFDKVAKITGLPYPGGPSIGKKALEGNPYAFDLPKAHMTSVSPALAELRREKLEVRSEDKNPDSSLFTLPSPLSASNASYDFSFSGVKTAVLRQAQAMCGKDFTFPSKNLPEALSEAQKADIAAVFQRIAIETVVDKTIQAFEEFSPASVVIAGGVAASSELRRQLSERLPIKINYTDMKLCTDNGAMIATLGCFKAMHKQSTADPYSLDIAPNLSM